MDKQNKNNEKSNEKIFVSDSQNSSQNSEKFPPFIKWGNFKSKDPKNPDVLELQVAGLERFETAYSENVRVNYKDLVQGWIEAILPLKSHESNNVGLLREWEKMARKDLEVNKHFKIKTWLATSKNGRPIRRFRLIF